MTATIRKNIIWVFLFLAGSIQAQEGDTVAVFYKTDKFEAAIFPGTSKDLFPGPSRFTPTQDDVNAAEAALSRQLAELNADKQNQGMTPVIDKHLKKYKRQYFGYVDMNGRKILFINMFWKRDKDNMELWLQEKVSELGGGSYFWNVKYNLETGELFDLDVNRDM